MHILKFLKGKIIRPAFLRIKSIFPYFMLFSTIPVFRPYSFLYYSEQTTTSLLLQPFYDIICQEALTVTDNRIKGLGTSIVMQKQMYMVWHDHIANYRMTPGNKKTKSFIHKVISFDLLNKGQPFIACKGDKINTGGRDLLM